MAGLIGPGISLIGNIAGGFLGSGAAKKAGGIIQQAGDLAAGNVTNAANAGQAGIAGAVSNAANTVPTQAGAANDLLSSLYNKGLGQFVYPYTQTGQNALGSLSNLSQNLPQFGQFSFNPQDLQNDPGYQFQLQQGQAATQNSAAAKGLLSSGNTLAALNSFGQGLAGTSYQNAFNRALQSYQTNVQTGLAGTQMALNTLLPQIQAGQTASGQGIQLGEFTGGQMAQNLINPSEFLANLGLQGATSSGQLGLQGAQIAGNFGMQGAEGAAGGVLGAGNAWAGALGGAANTLGGMNFGNLFGGGGSFPLGAITTGPQLPADLSGMA